MPSDELDAEAGVVAVGLGELFYGICQEIKRFDAKCKPRSLSEAVDVPDERVPPVAHESRS